LHPVCSLLLNLYFLQCLHFFFTPIKNWMRTLY
jgi:hypothetical protein